MMDICLVLLVSWEKKKKRFRILIVQNIPPGQSSKPMASNVTSTLATVILFGSPKPFPQASELLDTSLDVPQAPQTQNILCKSIYSPTLLPPF